MEIDQKLMMDIAPYSMAYGHMMSNIIYNYQYAIGITKIYDTEENKRNAEWFERVIRSFTVTKNLRYSKQLVSKDMGINESDIIFPTMGKLDEFYTPNVEPDINEFKKIQQVLKLENKIKNQYIITAENYRFCYGDVNIVSALEQFVLGNFLKSRVLVGGITFECKFFTYEEYHNNSIMVSFRRVMNDNLIPKQFEMELSYACTIFPEIKISEWVLTGGTWTK